MAYEWFVRDAETKAVLGPVAPSKQWALTMALKSCLGRKWMLTGQLYQNATDGPDVWRKFEYKKVWAA